MNVELKVLVFYTPMQRFSYKVVDSACHILTRELTFWIEVVVQECARPDSALDLSRFIGSDGRRMTKEYEVTRDISLEVGHVPGS